MKFAKESGELKGSIAVAELPRLHDLVLETGGCLEFGLHGQVDGNGKPGLRVSVAGPLMLTCHRCLGPMDFRIDATRMFELVPVGTPLADVTEEPLDVEQVHADPKMDVCTLVEDEVILALPMVIAHPEQNCTPLIKVLPEISKASPFYVLAGQADKAKKIH
ncbi:MAG: YceD family protein [Burkholderiales bacterium]